MNVILLYNYRKLHPNFNGSKPYKGQKGKHIFFNVACLPFGFFSRKQLGFTFTLRKFPNRKSLGTSQNVFKYRVMWMIFCFRLRKFKGKLLDFVEFIQYFICFYKPINHHHSRSTQGVVTESRPSKLK